MFGKARIKPGPGGVATPVSRPASGAAAKTIPLGRLWWAAILLLGLSAGAVGWTIWQLRADAIRAAISDSGNIAAVLAGQLSRSLESIDAVLLELKNPGKELDIEQPFDFRTALDAGYFIESLTFNYRDRLPQVFNIAIADETRASGGFDRRRGPLPDINVADRDYFNDARARRDGGLSTSVPIDNRIDGTRTIVFARRLEGPSGNFIGIVYASVNSKYFEDIYESTQSVRSLHIHPGQAGRNDSVSPSGRRGFRRQEALRRNGMARSISKGVDGFRISGKRTARSGMYRSGPVPGYPLFVNTSVTESTALAGWLQRSATIGLGSTVLLLCSLYLLVAITRQVRCLSDSRLR